MVSLYVYIHWTTAYAYKFKCCRRYDIVYCVVFTILNSIKCKFKNLLTRWNVLEYTVYDGIIHIPIDNTS